MGIEATLRWRRFSNAVPTYETVTMTLVGGYVFAMSRTYYNKENIYIFSLATQTWKPFWRFKGRKGHVTVLVEDKLYCIGGSARYGFNMPITEIDLVLGVEHDVKPTVRLMKHSAAYVEKREEIVIYGNNRSAVVGFNMNSKTLTNYRILGNYKPVIACASRQSTVALNGDIFVYGNPTHPQGTLMHILRLGDLHSATWSTVGQVTPLLQTARIATCVVNDLVVLFGGLRGYTNKNGLGFYNTRTGEWEVVTSDAPGTCTSEGPWPSNSVITSAICSKKTVWLLGGHQTQIFSLTIER